MDKVVVAIHGIGSQRRGDSIRSVAQRFGAYWEPPLPVMPLGYFHVGRGTEVHVSELETDPNHPAAAIGFAEVFWADIPRGVAASEDTLEETKAWGASVVSRARATYLRNVAQPKLAGADFDLGAGVIEEIVETLDVMENLLVVADKAGVFKFEIGQLLRDYIGDVQVVTEFKLYRDMILYRFHAAMAKIVDRFDPIGPDKNCEIYLVAHSEGSVVSFLAMLQALSAGRILDPEGKLPPIDTGWIRHVRGFMTIGSPIDKHIVLWPKLWDGLRFARQLEQPIKWRNYYDFGDPIGFKLDAARDFLGEKGCKAFDFEAKHDFGFSRYWLPGKAHTDYWQDGDVFAHFIADVVAPDPEKPPKPPRHHPVTGVINMAIPYFITVLLHVAAVFVLSKAMAEGEHARSYYLQQFAWQVGMLSALLLGVTVAARLPRLVKTARLRWRALALGVFLGAAGPCAYCLPETITAFLFAGMPVDTWVGRTTLVGFGFVVALSGWFVPRRPRVARRVLVMSGAVVTLGIIVMRLLAATLPVWTVVLGGAAFLYLWWLGVLLFDLTFVWHRYIRESVAVDTLHEWQRGRDACAG